MSKIAFNVAKSHSIVLQAKHLCHDVYLRMGYISHAYGDHIIPAERHAVYIVATAEHGEVIGTVKLSREVRRTIFDAWSGKLFASCGGLINHALGQRIFSIGSLAVDKRYAGLHVAHGLYRAAYEWAMQQKMDYGVIMIDSRALRALRMAGWYVVEVGEAAWYLGSPTIPAIIPIGMQGGTNRQGYWQRATGAAHQLPAGYLSQR